jgi:putative thioredoxin
VPSKADRLVESGDEASLRQALELEPDHVGARIALARRLITQGKIDEALEILEPVEHDRIAAALIAEVDLLRSPDASPLIRAALTRLIDGDPAGALPDLVAAVREASGEQRDLLRKVVVGVFGELGEEHPLTQRYRPELAAALY